MGLSAAALVLANPRRPDLPPIEAEALADTGCVHLVIPATMQRQLQLAVHRTESVTLADGSRREVPYVGPIALRFANRAGFCGAIVMGDQCLLGAIPMEDMDLVVRPRDRRVEVNPASPDLASTRA